MVSIEVEIKCLLSEEEYHRLLAFFQKHQPVQAENQETHYLEGKQDLRIQQSDTCAKIILKSGAVHDTAREETEIVCKREDFEKIKQIFTTLGHTPKVKWIRTRYSFLWDEISVTLDSTKGNGHMMELEQLATPQTQDETAAFLRKKILELGVQETPKDELKKRFTYYAQHWKELI